MDRRLFLQNLTLAAAAPGVASQTLIAQTSEPGTLVSEFTLDGATWKVYEDLAARDGAFTFVSGSQRRVLTKSAEASFPEFDPPYLGLKIADIGMADRDLLADKLLAHGEPDPEEVRRAAVPISYTNLKESRPVWTSFVGTKECADTMPVFPGGATRTYHPSQYFTELRNRDIAKRRYEGMLGGWMPVVRKLYPTKDNAYIEVLVFGDVASRKPFIVDTWHRTARIENGKVTKVVYGYSYPAYPPARVDPKPEEFYRALLVFANYWDRLLASFAVTTLPASMWVDFSKHAFAKEIMVRPGGVYPKYGAVDRDYYGNEYDGFQDTFTMSVYANLEWGRFDEARAIVDNYFSNFVDAKGMIDMRGPETAQFGLTLTLLAKLLHYTGDRALWTKHAAKIEATATLLLAMHDTALQLPPSDPGYGLIAGWSESDACLHPTPETWWKPYYANTAFAARGLKDLADAWPEHAQAREWRRRSDVMKQTLETSLRANIHKDKTPPYVPLLPGAKLTFRESFKKEWPSAQGWPHRPYAELLQADMLPDDLAHQTIDTMRAYGATTLGIVANVAPANPQGRDILGFISYGYAQALLRLDRIDEYLLFLYAHRYHDHTRGSWTAGEVAPITGDSALFCIPAQQTVPLLVRWALVMEDSDVERLHLGRALPQSWVVSDKRIAIAQAPTRWGRVDYEMTADPAAKRITARVKLARDKAPAELYVKMRVPSPYKLASATVNGAAAKLGGRHNDTVIIAAGGTKSFEIFARYA